MRPVCATPTISSSSRDEPAADEGDLGRGAQRLKQDDGSLPVAVDGEREASWIVADYLDVVLHVFTPEARQYYRLEDLWGDVPSVTVEAVVGVTGISKLHLAAPGP